MAGVFFRSFAEICYTFDKMKLQGSIAGGKGVAQLGLGGLIAAVVGIVLIAPIMFVLMVCFILMGLVASGVGVLLKILGRLKTVVPGTSDNLGRRNVRIRGAPDEHR